MSAHPPTPSNRPRRGELNAREIKFCRIFVERGNKTRSYIAAGFKNKTAAASAVAARKLLKKAPIQEFIRELRDTAADVAKLDLNQCFLAMANLARADRRRLWKDGCLLPPDQWPDDVAATIESIETDELFEPVPGQRGMKKLAGHTRKVKTSSRFQAWAKLGEWLGAGQPNAGAGSGVTVIINKGPSEVTPPDDEDKE